MAGLEYVCASDAQPPAKILPCLEKYNYNGVDDDDVDDYNVDPESLFFPKTEFFIKANMRGWGF